MGAASHIVSLLRNGIFASNHLHSDSKSWGDTGQIYSWASKHCDQVLGEDLTHTCIRWKSDSILQEFGKDLGDAGPN